MQDPAGIDGFESLIRKGELEKDPDLILSYMRTHSDNQALQESGILALSALARDVPSTREIIARHHSIQYVFEVLSKYRNKQQVQAAGVAFIANMALSKGNHEIIVMNRGVETVLLSMEDNKDTANIQGLCCTALCNLTKDNPKVKSHIVEKGAVEKVLGVLKVHKDEAEVQYRGFSVLRNLTSIGKEVCQKIVNADGITVIITGMAAQRSDENVTLQGISALLNLSCNSDVLRTEIGQKCIPGILLSIQAHSDNHGIVSGALALLSNLANTDSIRNLITQHTGIEVILSSLRTFTSRPEVLENACNALCNLALSTRSRVDICKFGGPRLLNQTMERFQSNVDLQKAAISAHKNLVSDDTKQFICEEAPRTVNAIAIAMTSHKGNHTLQTEACAALCNFATEETSATYMASESVAKVVISAIMEYPTRADLQASACKALGNLVLGCPNNLAVIIDNRGMEAMLTTMAAHASSVGVQEGCFCVLSAVARNESIELPRQEQQTTLDLVLEALHNHPSSDIVNMSGLYILAALIQNSNNNLDYILSRDPLKVVTDAVGRLPPGSGMEPVAEWVLETLTNCD